jgi:hypothetical protein
MHFILSQLEKNAPFDKLRVSGTDRPLMVSLSNHGGMILNIVLRQLFFDQD